MCVLCVYLFTDHLHRPLASHQPNGLATRSCTLRISSALRTRASRSIRLNRSRTVVLVRVVHVVPVMWAPADASAAVHHVALSQFPRCWQNQTAVNGGVQRCGDENNNTNSIENMADCHWTKNEGISYMGYSMRTNTPFTPSSSLSTAALKNSEKFQKPSPSKSDESAQLGIHLLCRPTE